MSKKETFDIFKLAGVRKEVVDAWQKKKNLTHLPSKAALQLYSRVELKRKLKQPYPVITVEKLWEKINGINTGVENAPTSNKLFFGLRDVTVVGLSNSITYVGCPECLKGQKKIGASKCSAHGSKLIDLRELSWNEWLVYGDEEEFIVKMSPAYTERYNEINMTGAVVWVEGTINLAEDPILMMVSEVWTFEAGNLMLGNIDDDGDIATGDDFTSGREDVDLSGFGGEEEKKNPFLTDEELVIENEKVEAPSGNVSEKFKTDFIKSFNTMLVDFVKKPVQKTMVERYLLDWVENNYPNEFANLDTFREKVWEIVEGLYTDLGDGMIDRVK